jgi:hypothetical protein
MRIRLVYRPSFRQVRVAELRTGRPERVRRSAPVPIAVIAPVLDPVPGPAGEPLPVIGPSRRLRLLRLCVLLLMRLATAGVAMAAWCIASELGFSVHFVFDKGLPQHWQIWFAAALFLYAGSALLARQLESAARRERIAIMAAARAA